MIVSWTKVFPDTVRVEVDDVIVGFALQLGNGMWRPYEPDIETAVTTEQFKTPKSAARALVESTQSGS